MTPRDEPFLSRILMWCHSALGNLTVCFDPNFSPFHSVRDGICVDPPLCRGTSQGKYGSCAKGLVCVGEIIGKIGEAGERELVLVVSVRCGKERDMTRG